MFSFVQFTDTHLVNKGMTEKDVDRAIDIYYRDVVKEACSNNIDFIVNCGDLCSGGCLSAIHERFKFQIDKLSEEFDIPYYVVKGGHEQCMNHDKKTNFAEYNRIYGKSMYWFEHKGWAFIALDRWYKYYRRMPMVWEDMSPEGMDVVENMLEEIPKNMPIVVFIHENPVGISGFLSGHMLYNILKKYPVKLLLFGHTHANYISTYEGIPHACIVGEGSSFDTAPLTYNLVSCFSDGNFKCDFKPVITGIPQKEISEIECISDIQIKNGNEYLSLRGNDGRRSCQNELAKTKPDCVWKTSLKGRVSVSCPKVWQESLFVTTQSKGCFDQCTVNALSIYDGAIKWTVNVDGDVPGGLVIYENKGYMGTTAGSLYCLDLKNGTVQWKWNNRENLPIACEPTVDEDGIIHFGANWEAYAVDSKSGKTVWRKLVAPQGAISYFSPGCSSPVVYKDKVYHQRNFNGGPAGFSSLLQSMDCKTGYNIQHSSVQNFPGQRHASPVVWNNSIVVLGDDLYVFDPLDITNPVLTIDSIECAATPAVKNSEAYVNGMNKIVACDLKQGVKIWEKEHEKSLLYFRAPVKTHKGDCGYGNFSAPVVSDGELIICDTGGNLRCLKTKNGSELWRFSVGSPILSAPVISANAIFVSDYEGNVYALAW